MIHVFTIAALSADGFIGVDPTVSSTTWTDKEDKQFFIDRTKKAGVVVMGMTTYETFNKPLKDRRNIVYSPGKTFEGVEITQEAPQDLIARLEKEGHAEVAICGGTTIYSMFLGAGLVDTVYFTVHARLFGKGIPFLNNTFNIPMELVNHTKIGQNTLLLEYKVIKN